MQKCDGVMASGRNVTTFAIPALQPLVLTLFVRPSRESPDLETQREVVLNMLLRLVSHHRIITLLCYVLECYSHRRQQWQQASVGGREERERCWKGEDCCVTPPSPGFLLCYPSLSWLSAVLLLPSLASVTSPSPGLLQVSSQIFAALLPHMGRLQVFLESREALLALYQLLTAMDPSAISIQVSCRHQPLAVYVVELL